MPKKRTYFVSGPPVKLLPAKSRERPGEVPLKQNSIKLEALPPEVLKRQEIARRLNIYSYWKEQNDSQQMHSLANRLQKQNSRNEQQSSMSPTGLERRTRNDSLTIQSSESLDSMLLLHGADLDNSSNGVFVDDGLAYPAGIAPSRSLSQQDLQNVLRMWKIETRLKGNEMGVSALGRELQKLYPSEVLPPTLYGEGGASIVPSESAGLSIVSSHELLFGQPPPQPQTQEQEPQAEQQAKKHSSQLPVITANFATLSNWQIGTNNPDAQLAYLSVVNSITVREASLLRLRSVLQQLDCCYWKYSVLRMKCASLHVALDSMPLLRLRKAIILYQGECRVAIAHYRGTTVQVLTDLQKWKKFCQQECQTDDTVQILWDGTNYLERMARDTHTLCRYTATRLWFDHAPSTFMTKPTPQTTFDLHAEQMYKSQTQRLHARLRELLGRLELHRKTTDAASAASARSGRSVHSGVLAGDESVPLSPLGGLSIADDRNGEGAEVDQDGLIDALLAGQSELEAKESTGDEEPCTTPAPSEKASSEWEEWEVLRDFCLNTWGGVRMGTDCDGTTEDELDAGVPEINPMVVECYLGFQEVSPLVPLLPLLPESLVEKCNKLATFVKRELRLVENLQVKRQISQQLRMQVESDLASTERNLLYQQDLYQPIKHQLLRLRQETGNTIMHSSKLLSAGQLSDVFAMTTTMSESKLHMQQSSDQDGLLYSQTSSQANLFQLSRNHSRALPHRSAPTLSQSAVHYSSSSEHLNRTETVKFSTFDSMFLTGEEFCIATQPRLDTEKITTALEGRVAEQRTLVQPQSNDVPMKTIRPEVLAKKPIDGTKPSWRNKMVVHIQRIIRGFVGRCRAAKKEAQRHRVRMATRIQKYWRGIWGRIRFVRCLREFRIRLLADRKALLTLDDSALTITHFVRYLGEKNVVGKEEASARSPLFNKKPASLGVYQAAVSLKSPKMKLGRNARAAHSSVESGSMSDAKLSDAEKEALLKPYRTMFAYRDEANFIQEVAEAAEKPERSLLSMLDTRNSSRLLLRPKGKLKPFSSRGRVFAEKLSSAAQNEPASSLAGTPHHCYLVPPSLATREEREQLLKQLDSTSLVVEKKDNFDFRKRYFS